jgi:hypothetical protein
MDEATRDHTLIRSTSSRLEFLAPAVVTERVNDFDTSGIGI